MIFQGLFKKTIYNQVLFKLVRALYYLIISLNFLGAQKYLLIDMFLLREPAMCVFVNKCN